MKQLAAGRGSAAGELHNVLVQKGVYSYLFGRDIRENMELMDNYNV